MPVAFFSYPLYLPISIEQKHEICTTFGCKGFKAVDASTPFLRRFLFFFSFSFHFVFGKPIKHNISSCFILFTHIIWLWWADSVLMHTMRIEMFSLIWRNSTANQIGKKGANLIYFKSLCLTKVGTEFIDILHVSAKWSVAKKKNKKLNRLLFAASNIFYRIVPIDLFWMRFFFLSKPSNIYWISLEVWRRIRFDSMLKWLNNYFDTKIQCCWWTYTSKSEWKLNFSLNFEINFEINFELIISNMWATILKQHVSRLWFSSWISLERFKIQIVCLKSNWFQKYFQTNFRTNFVRLLKSQTVARDKNGINTNLRKIQ